MQRRGAVQKLIELTLRLSIQVEGGMWTQFFADLSQGRMFQIQGMSRPAPLAGNRAGGGQSSLCSRPRRPHRGSRPADRWPQSHSMPPDCGPRKNGSRGRRAQRRPGRLSASGKELRLVGASRFERIQLDRAGGCGQGQISLWLTPWPAVRDRTPYCS